MIALIFSWVLFGIGLGLADFPGATFGISWLMKLYIGVEYILNRYLSLKALGWIRLIVETC